MLFVIGSKEFRTIHKYCGRRQGGVRGVVCLEERGLQQIVSIRISLTSGVDYERERERLY